MGGYGEQPQQPQQQLQQPTVQEQYEEEYLYNGDQWGKTKIHGDQAAQVREALFGCDLPSQDDFEKWFPALQSAIDLVARIPGFDTQIYAELNRDMEDLVDRANSQGRRRIIASKMQKFIFRLRSLVPKGDIPIAGVTGVTAMITTQSNQKNELRMPQQQAPTSIFGGVGKLIGGK